MTGNTQLATVQARARYSSPARRLQAKLEREFGREDHIITREDRLEAIAKDLVARFTGRGYSGNARIHADYRRFAAFCIGK